MNIKPWMILCCTFLVVSFSLSSVRADDSTDAFIKVKIITIAVNQKGEAVAARNKRWQHRAIVSDSLPHGIWEAGIGRDGMVATTNTVDNLSQWETYRHTQRSIDLGGRYVRTDIVSVNKNGLKDAIKLFEDTFVGKYKYKDHHDNYAITTVIYGAGGPELKK